MGKGSKLITQSRAKPLPEVGLYPWVKLQNPPTKPRKAEHAPWAELQTPSLPRRLPVSLSDSFYGYFKRKSPGLSQKKNKKINPCRAQTFKFHDGQKSHFLIFISSWNLDLEILEVFSNLWRFCDQSEGKCKSSHTAGDKNVIKYIPVPGYFQGFGSRICALVMIFLRISLPCSGF